MSVRVMSWVWEHSASSGAERLVLLAIADAAADDGGNAWPSVRTIAKKANIDSRTAQRAVRRLVEMGELKVREYAGQNGTHRYRVVMKTPRQDATPPGERPPGEMPPPRQDATLAFDADPPGRMPPPPRQDATRNVLEPSKNQELMSDRTTISSTDPRFVEFWNTYPKRVGRGAALRAFIAALKRAPVEDILKGAARYRDDPGRTEQYTAHASTWLNADRWSDEATVTQPPAVQRIPGDFSHIRPAKEF